MSARVLVVDDVPANIKLLEAKLMAEYFEVIAASNGAEAMEAAVTQSPDIILLDVMMPGTDGFEVCKRLKALPETAHIPVVMVTALDQQSDRVQGLDCGADDFLTKPVDDIALFARVKSLVRLKMMMDELRMRHQTGEAIGLISASNTLSGEEAQNAHILVVEDRPLYAEKIVETLGKSSIVSVEPDPEEAVLRARAEDFDLAVVSLSLKSKDGLRLCSQLRSTDDTRHLPILILAEAEEKDRLVRALDLGVNDYLLRPIDRNELTARARTQIRRKRYSDRLRHDFQASLEMAVTDQLTSLYNRRYLSTHLETLIQRSRDNDRPISLLIVDIDYFKAVNDTYGHDIGDVILKEFARRLASNVRGIDLACRYGGEEFVVVMPETDISFAYMVAERLRQEVADVPFVINDDAELKITVSVGATSSEDGVESSESLLKRADQALYRAKREGRNRVVAEAA